MAPHRQPSELSVCASTEAALGVRLEYIDDRIRALLAGLRDDLPADAEAARTVGAALARLYELRGAFVGALASLVGFRARHGMLTPDERRLCADSLGIGE